jgi:hypothetical protein
MHTPPSPIGAKCGLSRSAGSTASAAVATNPTFPAKKSAASLVVR